MIVLKKWKFTQFTLRKFAEFVTTFYQKEEIESNQLKTWGKLSMFYDDFDMSEENKKVNSPHVCHLCYLHLKRAYEMKLNVVKYNKTKS